jgi:hypothetical protein
MVFLDYKTVPFSGNGTKYTTEYKCMIIAEITNINFSGSGIREFYFTRSGQRQHFHKQQTELSISFPFSTKWIYESYGASHVIPAGVAISASGYTALTGVFHIYRIPESP